MPKIRVNGIDLHYISVGAGADIVMLHGFLGNLAVWHLYMAPILRREYRVTTYDLRGHGYSDVTATGYTTADMAEDLRCFLDAMGLDRPILVGHSFGADIAMYFSLLYPERVPKLLALEPGLAALVHLRNDKNWIGWAAWVAKLEEAGIQVPEEKRTDAGFLLQLSLETPKFYGPARGLPRNREPLLHLIRNTTLLKDYEVVGDMTLEAVRTIRTPTLLNCFWLYACTGKRFLTSCSVVWSKSASPILRRISCVFEFLLIMCFTSFSKNVTIISPSNF